jgi:hypothetical protein
MNHLARGVLNGYSKHKIKAVLPAKILVLSTTDHLVKGVENMRTGRLNNKYSLNKSSLTFI